MCIRDRVVVEEFPAEFFDGAFAGGDAAGVDVDQVGPALGPVSYTHLRAHETVLDLVCRLLLEKKKKKKIKTINRTHH